MGSDIRTGIGYLIPIGALVGFVLSLLTENYLLSIFFAIAGVLLWLLYMVIMKSPFPNTLGNIIILFGAFLTVGIFMAYGLEQNMFGGYELRGEGAVFALIILFFSVLAGILFNRGAQPAEMALTESEKELVRKAIGETDDKGQEHRVIVVKQEPSAEEEGEEEEYDYGEYDPYLYTYPPGYEDYYEEEYEEEEED